MIGGARNNNFREILKFANLPSQVLSVSGGQCHLIHSPLWAGSLDPISHIIYVHKSGLKPHLPILKPFAPTILDLLINSRAIVALGQCQQMATFRAPVLQKQAIHRSRRQSIRSSDQSRLQLQFFPIWQKQARM